MEPADHGNPDRYLDEPPLDTSAGAGSPDAASFEAGGRQSDSSQFDTYLCELNQRYPRSADIRWDEEAEKNPHLAHRIRAHASNLNFVWPPANEPSQRRLSRAEAKKRIRDVIGGYRLEHLIGCGGMGAVYEAVHSNGTRAALKLILARHSGDDRYLERFRREVALQADLDHPHVCKVLDHGTQRDASGEESAYLVMELLDGETLDRLISRDISQELFTSELLPAFEGVLDALSYVHARDIVHRDIKPGNIFRRTDGQLLLLDFGIARVEIADQSSITETGAIVGTYQYMAPEQLQVTEHLTAQADLYSLGVVLHECATRRKLVATTSVPQTMMAIISERPTRLGKLAPNLPAGLSHIVERLLEKRPADRYPDAQAVLVDWRKLLRGETVRVPLAQRRRRLTHWAKAHKFHLLSALILLLAALVIGFAMSWRREKRRVESAVDRVLQGPIASVSVEASELPESRWAEVRERLAALTAGEAAGSEPRLRRALALERDGGEFPRPIDDELLACTDPSLLSRSLEFLDTLPVEQRERCALLLTESDGPSNPGRVLTAAALLAHDRPVAETHPRLREFVPTLVTQLGELGVAAALRWTPLFRSITSLTAPQFRERWQRATERQERQDALRLFLGNDPSEAVANAVAAFDEGEAADVEPCVETLRAHTDGKSDLLARAEQIREQLVREPDDADLVHQESLAMVAAHQACALAQLGEGRLLRDVFESAETPQLVLAWTIENAGKTGLHVDDLLALLEQASTPAAKRAILLALGSFVGDRLEGRDLTTIEGVAIEAWISEPSASVHSAATWLLAHLDRLPDEPPAARGLAAERAWRYHPLGLILLRLEVDLPNGKTRRLEVAATELPFSLYRKFATTTGRDFDPMVSRSVPDGAAGMQPNWPLAGMSIGEAFELCNWLSETDDPPVPVAFLTDGPESQQILTQGREILRTRGFRPWTQIEYAGLCSQLVGREQLGIAVQCRAFDAYGQIQRQLKSRYGPVFGAKPGPAGVFGILGNVSEYALPEAGDGALEIGPGSWVVYGCGGNSKVAEHVFADCNMHRQSAPSFKAWSSISHQWFGLRIVRLLSEE